MRYTNEPMLISAIKKKNNIFFSNQYLNLYNMQYNILCNILCNRII